MSEENVEVVKACYDLFAKGDFEGILQYVDPEGEVIESRQMPDAQTFHGHDGFLAAIDHWAGEFDDFQIEIERLVDAEDAVIAYVRQRARGRQSGVPVETQVANVYTFRDGRVVRWQMFTDFEEALEAAGLSE
jgi:ketosteroid isomerase-like protein